MLKLLHKELRLSASVLSYLFIAFGLIALVPGYPILVGTFFLCLGLFQSFQGAVESNDITYTALLPVAKADVVRSKFIFCIFIELCYFVLTAAVTLVRMTFLADAAVYQNNVLMNANFTYLGLVLIIAGLFNLLFVGGFFKTSYKYLKPFVLFIGAAFLMVGLGETLFHIPGLSALNAPDFTDLSMQAGMLVLGLVVFVGLSAAGLRLAEKNFEKTDL